ncbi:MAG: tetratricopeptide repeat protein [Candidatus Omnitrophica bacterium]|nr:tetratricopeptide repeat protein [Candidatus Omnitrophota bacterium]
MPADISFYKYFVLVHPVQTGAVAYISGRADLLACFFILLAFIFYIGFEQKAYRALSLITFVLAILSKEIAIVFPLALIIYDIIYKKASFLSGVLKRYSGYLAVVIVYIGLRLMVFDFTPAKETVVPGGDIIARIMTMWRILTEYLCLLIYPSNLHMEREIPVVASAFSGEPVLAVAGFICALFLTVTAYKKSRTVFFGIAWFLLFLIPVSNIVPINALMAEHWLYIPSIGFFLAVSALLTRLTDKKAVYIFVMTLFIIVALLYGFKSAARNKDWKNDLSIYSSTLKFSPKKARIYYNLGTAYGARGLLENAVKYYNLAIEKGMKESVVYANLAITYTELGRYKEAEDAFCSAIALNPDNPFAHNGLGGLYEKMNLKEKAMDEYKKVLISHPDFYEANVNIGALYGEKGEHRKALYYFKKAFSVKKDKASYYNLGYAYYKSGDREKAKETWEESLRKYPHDNPAEKVLKK